MMFLIVTHGNLRDATFVNPLSSSSRRSEMSVKCVAFSLVVSVNVCSTDALAGRGGRHFLAQTSDQAVKSPVLPGPPHLPREVALAWNHGCNCHAAYAILKCCRNFLFSQHSTAFQTQHGHRKQKRNSTSSHHAEKKPGGFSSVDDVIEV